MPLVRTALAVSIPFVLASLLAAPARADDDEPAPRPKVRVHVQQQGEPREGADRSPLATIHRWMQAREERARKDALERWFAGGKDVPLADLRDALKADGWNADSMREWMRAHPDQVPQVLRRFLDDGMPRFRAPQRAPAVRAPRGPVQGPGPHGACPLCGRGPAGPADDHGHRSPAELHGLIHGLLESRTQGAIPFPMQGGHAWILWNDGSGWHHAPMGPGAGGPAPPGPHPMPFHAPRPEDHSEQGGVDRQHLRELLRRLLEGRRDGEAEGGPMPPHPPMPPVPPAPRRELRRDVRVLGPDGGLEDLKDLLESLEGREDVGEVRKLLEELGVGPADRKLRIRVVRPEGGERRVEILEDVEVHDVEVREKEAKEVERREREVKKAKPEDR